VLSRRAIEAGGKRFPSGKQRATSGVNDDNWRIYARSSSDDKSPIVALLAAIDACVLRRFPWPST